MKRTLLAAIVLGLTAMPAMADDSVPQSTLKSLGLGQMKVISDAEGMQIRGMSSFAASTNVGTSSGTLLDPLTGSNVTWSSARWSASGATNGGPNVSSSSISGGINVGGGALFTPSFGGFGIGGSLGLGGATAN